jgi:hypothetical protein
VLHGNARDLAVSDVGRDRVLSVLVDDVVAGGLDPAAEQLLTGLVVMFPSCLLLLFAFSLSLSISETNHHDHAEND